MSSPARTRTLYEYIESLPEGYAGEIVDPKRRTVEALANERGRWVDTGAASGDESIRLPPFEAVAIRPPWT